MKDIIFFNHFHNGDVFHSRGFVQFLMDYFPDTNFWYHHPWGPKLLQDMRCGYRQVLPTSDQLHKHTQLLESTDSIFINTWVGAWFDDKDAILPYKGETNFRFNYYMYEKIYEVLSQWIGKKIDYPTPSEVVKLFPAIDYSKFPACQNINIDKSKKSVLFSNGPVHSGQCNYTGNLSEIIEFVADSYPAIDFYATHKYNSSKKNVIFTSDIIKTERPDLNEISYISTFCNLIIGRNSGPFCFTTTKDNILTEGKKFFSFGKREQDSFFLGIEDVKCRFYFHYYEKPEVLYQIINDLVKEENERSS
jgi:hypothetical protein